MASIISYRLFTLLILVTMHFYLARAIVNRRHVGKAARPPPDTDSESQGHKVFIVYLGGISATTTKAHTDAHLDMLSEVLGSTQAARGSILYSYRHSFNGFAALFSESDAEALREKDTVVSVFRSRFKQPQTTLSWENLGLTTTGGVWPKADFGSDVIVGLIDTGIWPESKSFQDDGLGPIPAKWKGLCVTAEQFDPSNCNRKLIGARYYYKGYEAAGGYIESPDYLSPRDSEGHGSHTASTVAGDQVPNANFFGLANGTASGGVPSARLAMYKVCWLEGCVDSDILAAFDDAIADGVDILSVSLGSLYPSAYYDDSIAIGSFHAVDRGILVSASTGNAGPDLGTASNLAPWLFTVGANTLNRAFITPVQLGDGVTYDGKGMSIYLMNASYPLVYAGDIPGANYTAEIASICYPESLDPVLAFGKVIVCLGPNGTFYYYPDDTVNEVGGVGIIMIGTPFLYPFSVSGTAVTTQQGDAILAYISNSSSPTARIGATITGKYSSFQITMAEFSSVGPNYDAADISKPDITAPGVEIIAAWSLVASPTGFPTDNRTTNFNIVSGTSMACPHVAGAAALVKSLHPTWSPAAIKSALMTTATPLKKVNVSGYDLNTGLATGSGQINPTLATDPGLIFNLSSTDFVNFLCAQGYNTTAIQLITGKTTTCAIVVPMLNLNYPSIFLTSDTTNPRRAKRTLTNVGPPAVYTVTVVPPTGVNVTVTPSSLSFTAVNQELSFTVLIDASDLYIFDYLFGSIVWSDGTHSVRIPIGVGVPY